MRLSDAAKKRMSQMDAASQRATSNHFDQTYKNLRPQDAETADSPPALTVVPDDDVAGGGEAPAATKKRATGRKSGPKRSAPAATEVAATEPGDDAPVADEPVVDEPAAADEGSTVPKEQRHAPGEVGPTEDLPTSERRKYTIDITPELRNALVQLLIRDVEEGRKVAQWQHADGAVTHFLPEPTETVPKHGETWTEFGIALTHENRKRVELLKLKLRAAGRTQPFRCYIAEAIRRYIEALAPDLAKDLPK